MKIVASTQLYHVFKHHFDAKKHTIFKTAILNKIELKFGKQGGKRKPEIF